MIVYHSAFNLEEEYAKILRGRRLRLLRSYHGTSEKKRVERPSYCSGLFLDSGAFSAFRSKAKIDLVQYIEYLKREGEQFDIYAGLDVIGNPEQSWKNQLRMDRAGLRAIPTFHVGEPWKVLDRYLDYDYMALGGMVPHSGSDYLKTWLNDCWRRIESSGKQPRVHGFGLTDLACMRCYPWYSVDSTTAARAGRTGLLVSPWALIEVSSGIKTKSARTIGSDGLRAKVMEWLQEEFDGMVDSWQQIGSATKEASQMRIVLNAMYIERVAEQELERPKIRTGFGLS